jgi:inosine kinase
MRFPGQRLAKYYFPVSEKRTSVMPAQEDGDQRWYAVGLDEVLVDLEVHDCTPELVRELGLVPSESVQLAPDVLERLLERVTRMGLPRRFVAGGTVANTLANFTHLSGEPAVLLGTLPEVIRPGSPAFAYVAQTPRALSLEHLRSARGALGLAVTCFTPDGERSFGVAPGISGDYPQEDIPEDVIRRAGVALTSAYLLADPDRPIAGAAMRMMQIAKNAGVPVAFGLGTAGLVERLKGRLIDVLDRYVTIAAMNASEALALTGESDTLLACRRLLDWVDAAVVTEGARGLTLCGYTDDVVKRQTRAEVRSKAIPDYNRWEYSRLLLRRDCEQPLRVFSHIHPYRGGPAELCSTSGAGDGALAAFIHDVSANTYHRTTVPDSGKHIAGKFLTYSSLSRCAQYGNRVAYEVLRHRSPRLDGPVGADDERPAPPPGEDD